MKVKLSEVIRTVTRAVRGKTHIEDYIDAKTISETGTGVASNDPGAGADSGSEVTEVQLAETLRRVVSETPANN